MEQVKNDTSIKNLLALICIVLLSTIATSMVFTVLPAFFKRLGLTYAQIGCIEGLSAFTAFTSKFFAGICSDRTYNRRSIIVLGTGLNVVSKALFAFATGFVSLFAVQIFDRMAKGLRSCPLDAKIADLTTEKTSGIFYGLKYSAYLSGCIIGGLITYALLRGFGENFRFIFLLAAIPSLAAFVLSRTVLEEADDVLEPHYRERAHIIPILRSLGKEYWLFIMILFVMTFARFGTSFIGIKALDIGVGVFDLPRIMIIYNCIAAPAALVSALVSRDNKGLILRIAIVLHFFAMCLFAFALSKLFVIAGVVLAGMHIGLSQGIILSFISRFTTALNKATAFSMYYLIVGIGELLSNTLAGNLSSKFGDTSGAFYGGAFFCIITFCLLSMKKIFQQFHT